jgi:hypothetical protein
MQRDLDSNIENTILVQKLFDGDIELTWLVQLGGTISFWENCKLRTTNPYHYNIF